MLFYVLACRNLYPYHTAVMVRPILCTCKLLVVSIIEVHLISVLLLPV